VHGERFKHLEYSFGCSTITPITYILGLLVFGLRRVEGQMAHCSSPQFCIVCTSPQWPNTSLACSPCRAW